MKRWMITLVCVLTAVALIGGTGLANPYDFNGETLRIAHYWMGPNSMTEGPDLAHREWVEETFNVQIEFVQVPWYEVVDAWSTSILAGMPVADVAYMELGFAVERFAPEGLLYPLDEVLEPEYFASLPPSHANYANSYGSFQGSIYAFSGNGYQWNAMGDEARLLGVVWNKDLFERVGLPNLYDVYEAGDWTWDTLLELATAATMDSTGDGEIDQYGVIGHYGGWGATEVFMFAATNNAQLVREIEGGGLEFAFDEPAAIETLEFVRDLNLVHGVAHTQWLNASAHFTESGSIAMLFYPQHYFAYNYETPGNESFGWVPLPKGPRADEHISYVYNTSMWGLPITNQNPRASIEVVNALFQLTDTYMDMETYFDEAVWSSPVSLGAYDMKTLEIWESQLLGHWVVNEERAWRALLEPANFQGAIGSVLGGDVPARTAMDQVSGAVQAILDEVAGL